MSQLQILSAHEQVAAYLRQQIARGIWKKTMPGSSRLCRELGVGRMTIESALRLLEQEGMLLPQGAGKKRLIQAPESLEMPSLKVEILLYSPEDEKLDYHVSIRHQLMNAGHHASFSTKTLSEMKMDISKVSRYVANSSADAWIVISGSREILNWFAEHNIPAFALAGRRRGSGLPSAGPDKIPPLRDSVRRLVELGHSRIVLLTPDTRRKPAPGNFERAFLDELSNQGIQHGPYNLPDWEETGEGLRKILDSLFQHTPPTALIIVESFTFIATMQYLAQQGITAPRDISLICDDPGPQFRWCEPTVSHFHWESAPIARRAVQWAGNVAQGKKDVRESFNKATFVEGGTIGPVPHQS